MAKMLGSGTVRVHDFHVGFARLPKAPNSVAAQQRSGAKTSGVPRLGCSVIFDHKT